MRISLTEAQKRVTALTEFSMAELTADLNHTLLEFVLTYSTFESLFGGNREFLSKKPYQDLDLMWSKPYFDFFVDRYVSNGATNSKFKRHFQNETDENWVKEKLLSKGSASTESMFLVVFKIAYRFRNNFLHGNKGKAVYELPQHSDNFKQITKFMQHLMHEIIKKEINNGKFNL